MKFEFQAEDVERKLASARSRDELTSALQEVINLQQRLSDTDLHGWKMFSPGLDRQLMRIAQRFGSRR